MAVKKTFYYKSEVYKLKNRQNIEKVEEKKKYELSVKNKKLESILSRFNYTDNNFGNYLLQFINQNSDSLHISISNFQEPLATDNISHYTLILQGDFNKILILINRIDNNPILGNIIHINTEKKVNYKSQKEDIITLITVEKQDF
jgi:hypothetical protein